MTLQSIKPTVATLPLTPLRRTLLRACYALLVLGLAATQMTRLPIAANLDLMEGVVTAMLSALGLLSVIGLFRPLAFIPLLVFEVVWKLIWVLSVALPRGLNGGLDTATGDILFACAFAIPIAAILPWRAIFQSLVGSDGHSVRP